MGWATVKNSTAALVSIVNDISQFVHLRVRTTRPGRLPPALQAFVEQAIRRLRLGQTEPE